MEMTFKLEILTLSREYLREDVHGVIAPGSEGRFSVHAGHAAGIFALDPGILEVFPSAGVSRLYAVGGGFLVVEPGGKKVSIMVRSAETPDEIDERRAREALERARRRLNKNGSEQPQDLDISRAERALARAMARLKAKPTGFRHR
jgi:F-type H+-transporting ATPase subunit epsilon